MKSINQSLREFYLDYVNNYLTIDVFARDNNLTTMQACKLLDMAKELHEDYVTSEWIKA